MSGRGNRLGGRAPSLLALTALILLSAFVTADAGEPVALHEDFLGLERWEPLYFPKINSHSGYSTAMFEGTSVLVANSSVSASAIILNSTTIDAYETPIISWRWRVENIYEKGDISTKKGDDAPIRLYVMFAYDPELAGVGMKVKYALARAIYGSYPPHASLNYIWASKVKKGELLKSAYTDRSAMIVMQSGKEYVGQWVEEQANMLEDYRKAFGQEPPHEARLAIMSDSDNTGESARAYVDFIEVGALTNSPAHSGKR